LGSIYCAGIIDQALFIDVPRSWFTN